MALAAGFYPDIHQLLYHHWHNPGDRSDKGRRVFELSSPKVSLTRYFSDIKGGLALLVGSSYPEPSILAEDFALRPDTVKRALGPLSRVIVDRFSVVEM